MNDGRPEPSVELVMEWCDENGVDFVFGLPGNAVLDRRFPGLLHEIRRCVCA
jgi:hypothetical protein